VFSLGKSSYDKKSVKSIVQYAQKLTGRNLQSVSVLPPETINRKNRGNLGELIEEYFFQHTPPNNHEPDFKEARLELKTTGVVRYKNPKGNLEPFKAKERLFLTSINFRTIHSEVWESSTLLSKCNLMLILLYEYDSLIPVIEQEFVLKPLLILLERANHLYSEEDNLFILNEALTLTKEDLATIKRDWEFIRQKIVENKAHELSEGDTYYLGACRKGSGGENELLRKQLNSDVGAKSRAFALKQSFMTRLIQGHSKSSVTIGVGAEKTFEVATLSKFQPYIGLTEEEISNSLKFWTTSKSRKFLLAKRILSKSGQNIEEFEKAGILLKTVSLTKTGKGRESLSFPAFKFLDIVAQDWEDSEFSYQIESRFLFVVFKEDENQKDRLEKIVFWNMPHEDRLEAKRVWEDTKRRILRDASDLPRTSESKVAHVRPHATKKKDTDLTPQGDQLTKRCFWLNMAYIAEVVGNKSASR
jgi:DNA mismatch repair protein MutH